MDFTFKLFILGSFVSLTLASDTCWTDTGFAECSNGCCAASDGLEECCSVPVVAIVFAVIGGLVLISIIVCLCCACVNKKGNPGRVIQPQEQTTVSTVHGQYGPVYGYPSGFQHPPPSAPPPPYESHYGPQYPEAAPDPAFPPVRS